MSSEKEFTAQKKAIPKDEQDKSEEGKSRTLEKSMETKEDLGASQAICEEKTKHAASEKSVKAKTPTRGKSTKAKDALKAKTKLPASEKPEEPKSLAREKSAIELYPDKDMKLVYRGDKDLLVNIQRSSLEEPQQYSFQSSSIISSLIPPKNKQTLQIEVESREEDTTIEIKLLENQETSERLKETTKASSKGSSESSSQSGENINKNVIPDNESETFAIGKPDDFSESRTASLSKQSSEESSVTVSVELENVEGETPAGKIKKTDDLPVAESKVVSGKAKISSKGSSESSSPSGENINKNVIAVKGSKKFAKVKPDDCSESRTASLSTQSSEERSATEGTVSVENVEGETPAGKLKKTDDLPLAESQVVSGQANPTPLWVQILNSHPLIGISNPQIYFTKLFENFCSKIDSNQMDTIKTEFSAIDNDYKRIEYVLQFTEVKGMIALVFPSKSEEYANELENEYEPYRFSKNAVELDRAFRLINRSIQYTDPRNTRGLANRFMKRAWTKVMYENFDGAKIDADKSLSYYKEYISMWHCYEILGYCYANKHYYKKSQVYFEIALEGLRNSNTNDRIKVLTVERIHSVYNQVKGQPNDRRGEDPIKKLVTPRISYRINETLKRATDAVEVKIKEESGKGLYAKRDIKPGDVIIVEKPYVSALNRECFETHCNNCYKRSKSFLPCNNCSRVWFCEECFEISKWKKSFLHSSECHVLNLLYDETIGCMGIIVFRILLTLTWEKIKSLKGSRVIDTKLPDTSNTEFNLKKKYYTEDYLNTYKLVTNSQKRNFDDLFKRSISAVYIKQCLKATDFFKGEDVSSEDEIFVASLILRHLQNSSCNAHGITEYIVGENYLDGVNLLEVTTCIYPTISLINHSCSPNVFRYCMGKDCAVRATKTIKKGEQLFDNYGPLSEVMGREERRITLANQYKFDCNCLACEEDWPLYEDNNVYAKFACPVENCDQILEYDEDAKDDDMKCLSCGFTKKHKVLMKEAREEIGNLKDGIIALCEDDREKAFLRLKQFQMYADEKIIPPSKCLSGCQESLKRCLLLKGNQYDMKKK